MNPVGIALHRSVISSHDNSQILPAKFNNNRQPLEVHSMMQLAQQGEPAELNKTTPVAQTVQNILVNYIWVDQTDNKQVDKNDCKLTLLLSNTSEFDWKQGMTYVLSIGNDKEEYPLPEEVKRNKDVSVTFDLRKYLGRDLRNEKTTVQFLWKDQAESKKYFSTKTKLTIEFV